MKGNANRGILERAKIREIWNKENPKTIREAKPKVNPIEVIKKQSDTLDNLNPTWWLYVEYTPEKRATMKLWSNITTLDKTLWKDSETIITIYRWAPKIQKEIVPWDFVTTSKELAKSYAWEWKVIEMKVKASDVLDDINEPLWDEYIYRPSKQAVVEGKNIQLEKDIKWVKDDISTLRQKENVLWKDFSDQIREKEHELWKLQEKIRKVETLPDNEPSFGIVLEKDWKKYYPIQELDWYNQKFWEVGNKEDNYLVIWEDWRTIEMAVPREGTNVRSMDRVKVTRDYENSDKTIGDIKNMFKPKKGVVPKTKEPAKIEPVSKELQPLYEEARKYKSAREFSKVWMSYWEWYKAEMKQIDELYERMDNVNISEKSRSIIEKAIEGKQDSMDLTRKMFSKKTGINIKEVDDILYDYALNKGNMWSVKLDNILQSRREQANKK